MATSFNDDWQTGKNVLQCNKYMLDNRLYCDVKFQVGKAGKLISAHKYVLASRSSVFAAMFYGGLPETSDVIVVSDIEPEVFDILLRFLYYENGEVTSTTVTGTLYAAEKYAVKELVSLCRSYLESNINEETVCAILENSRIFSMTNLFSKCMTFIFRSKSCAEKVFESQGFLQCSRECLEFLIKDDKLPLPEEMIYKSLIRWAEHNCAREETVIENSTDMRNTLGSLILHVRFPLMSLETFWKVAGETEILSDKEKNQISRLIVGYSVKDTSFITTPRRTSKPVKMQIMRIKNETTDWSWSVQGSIDAIEFEVNKPLLLHGLILYGSDSLSYTYDIEVKLLSRSKATLAHVSEKRRTESTKVFQVNFYEPCSITPNERYTAWVKMSGPQCYRGNYCDCVDYKDFIFKFFKSNESTNGTDVVYGQIPGLLCCLEE
uniref:BTB/POZ domain-containing protein 6-like isoform X1 n=1 Tax=Crassostrea virginica TaxID=6565 RepID=A0A8B8BWJ8_CRAVI|nr:BTB/POZ domain-containing protein 6-like isoform X1 [Crassostrea virginica]